MNSINIYENKTLKLQNVIVRRLDLESDDQNLFDSEIKKISTYIQTHGANQIGPLIRYSKVELDGCNYTIYVDRNEEEETMVADVFMPVKGYKRYEKKRM